VKKKLIKSPKTNQMQANLRDNLQRSESESPYKEQLGAYHEKLMRVEATLGEIMSELAGEHEASCTLLTELDQEQRIAKLIAEKIRNHEGLVARSSEHTTSIEDVIAQRYGEMEHLRNQIAETQAEATRNEQEFETELAHTQLPHSACAEDTGGACVQGSREGVREGKGGRAGQHGRKAATAPPPRFARSTRKWSTKRRT
jgi:hypothetical protein